MCVCIDDAELQSNHQAEQLPVAEQDSKRFGQVTDAEAVHTYLFIHWSTCCPTGGELCFHDALVPTGIASSLIAVTPVCTKAISCDCCIYTGPNELCMDPEFDSANLNDASVKAT